MNTRRTGTGLAAALLATLVLAACGDVEAGDGDGAGAAPGGAAVEPAPQVNDRVGKDLAEVEAALYGNPYKRAK